MQTSIEFKGFEPDDDTRLLVNRLIESIERMVRRFSPVMLRIVLDGSPHQGRRASITLDLPGKTFAAATEAPFLEPAIRGAVAEIERQVEKYKASVRGEEWWKRLARRKKLRESKGATPAGSGGI